MSRRETPAKSPMALDLSRLEDKERVSLCETLDRVLNKGAVVAGEITISVAEVELIYLGLQLVVSSAETARGAGGVGLTIDIGKAHQDGVERNGAG